MKMDTSDVSHISTQLTTNNQPKEKTMETQNIEKKYILIHFHNGETVIIMNNDFAVDYMIKYSYEIETMEYITLVIPS